MIDVFTPDCPLSTTTPTLCHRSQQLCSYRVSVVNDYVGSGHCVSVVNDYADMCQFSQRLRGHRVSVFNEYADKLTNMKLFYFGKSKKLTKKVTKV